MHKNYSYLILFSCFFLLIQGCEKDLTPLSIDQTELRLIVEDIGVTEAWLKLKSENGRPEYLITITRNDSTIKQFNILSTDTLIYDSGLLPNQDYTYTATLTTESKMLTTESQLTTMDTTSHDFNWEILTFGDGNSSVIRDVFIIDSDDIWAVGEIYLNDSTGQIDPQPYGAIHWNGLEWELMKVPYHDYGTTNIYPGPLRTVFAFDSNNVYVTSSANLLKWDGESWTEKAFFMTGIPFKGQVRKMWASSENDIYCVGNTGVIYNYDGQTWLRIETGTDLPINDIWGNFNNNTGEYEVLCVANYILHDTTKKVLQISGTSVNEISIKGFRSFIDGVWFIPQRKYYIVGSGIFYNNDISKQDIWQIYPPGSVTNYHTHKIKGNSINDVVAVGSFGEIVHFNGYTWKNYYNVTQLNSGAYYSVDIKDDVIIAAGYLNSKAVIAIGSR